MNRFNIICLALFFAVIGLVGCNNPSPMEMRRAEFAYTPEKLAEDLAKRLKNASANRARQQAESERGADVRERESDRGGDGDRPDPASVQAIVTDAIVKIKGIQDAGTEDAAERVLEMVAAESEISDSVKQEFESGVKAGLSAK